MKIRRMGQTLSASCPFQSPLLNFLAPSISHKSAFAARRRSHLVFALPISQRPLTSYHSIRRAYSSSSPNPAGFLDAENSDDTPGIQRVTPAAPAPSGPKTSKPFDALDNLIAETISATPAARHRGSSKRPSSLRDIQEAYTAYTAAQDRHAKQGDIAGSMVMPGNTSHSSTVNASNMVSDHLEYRLLHKRAVRTIKSRPSLGRTIEITAKVDIAKSFQLLRRLAYQNKIKHDQQLQRFHERPGVRRKRLRRERWRARFNENFHKAVEKVKAMRRMGW